VAKALLEKACVRERAALPRKGDAAITRNETTLGKAAGEGFVP